MKKLISTILALSIMMTMCVPAFADRTKLGDVNADSNITAVDARMILQVVAGSKEETDFIKSNGDLNNDGKISAVDARIILQVVAGIIPAPEKPNEPCEHDFGQYAFEPETCTEDGTRYMMCNICGMKTEESIPATGHNFKDDVCIDCGYDDYQRKLAEYKEYEKLINKQIAEIEAEGPVYTGTDEQFNKEVSNLNSQIRELDRKIMSLSGDTSSSGKAQLARAKAERDSLQKELDELYAAKSRASQIEALEAELEYYEDRLFA